MKIKATIRDSSGKESRTLFFVAVPWVVLVGKFAFAGLDFGLGVIPPMTATEFSLAIASVLAIWLGREFKEAHYKDKPTKV